jgi:hypothetical protein
MTFDPEIAACIYAFAGADHIEGQPSEVGVAPLPEAESRPAQVVLLDLRTLSARRELTRATVSEMSKRWRTFATERRVPIRFAIVAGELLPLAEQFEDELQGSVIEVRVFATKADAAVWLDQPCCIARID